MFGLSTLAVAWWRKHACRCGSYLLVSNKSCPPFDGMAVMLEVKSEYIGWWKTYRVLSTILHRFNNRPTCPRRQVPEREVRAWCAENGVPGSVYYCFHIMGGVDQLKRQYSLPCLQWYPPWLSDLQITTHPIVCSIFMNWPLTPLNDLKFHIWSQNQTTWPWWPKFPLCSGNHWQKD